MKRLLAVVAAFVVANCAAMPPSDMVAAPVVMPDAVYGRAYALPGQDVMAPPSVIVALKQDDVSRNRAFCDSFVLLPAEQDLRATQPDRAIVPVRWLLRAPVADVEDCGDILRAYDYGRSRDLLDQAASGIEGQGPFLIQYLRVDGRIEKFVIDLSEVDSSQFGAFPSRLRAALQGQAEGDAPDDEDQGNRSMPRQACRAMENEYVAIAIGWLAEALPFGGAIRTGAQVVCEVVQAS